MIPHTQEVPSIKRSANVKGITYLFALALMIILATASPRGVPVRISPSQFVNLTEANRVFATSGRPLELWTDNTTGQLYLRGIYYDTDLRERNRSTTYFQVPLSADSKDFVMNAVSKAGLEVINVSDSNPMNPAVRQSIVWALLLATVVGYLLTLYWSLHGSPRA
jgi:hypothetical protein